MRKLNTILTLVFFLMQGFSGTAFSRWNILTEELPPFNFIQDGEIQGISTDLLLILMEKTGTPINRKSIRIMPWPRAYNTVLTQPNSILFSAARTAQREKLFKWVGPITTITTGLIARKDRNIRIDTIEDVQKYSIGTIRDGAPEQLVLKAGIPETSLDRISNPELNIKKLKSGRIDMFAFSVPTTKYLMIKLGLDPDNYEVVYILKEVELYYAFNTTTDDTIIEHMNTALRELKRPDSNGESTFKRIADSYLNTVTSDN